MLLWLVIALALLLAGAVSWWLWLMPRRPAEVLVDIETGAPHGIELPPLPPGATGWRVYNGATVVAEIYAPPRGPLRRARHWLSWRVPWL